MVNYRTFSVFHILFVAKLGGAIGFICEKVKENLKRHIEYSFASSFDSPLDHVNFPLAAHRAASSYDPNRPYCDVQAVVEKEVSKVSTE